MSEIESPRRLAAINSTGYYCPLIALPLGRRKLSPFPEFKSARGGRGFCVSGPIPRPDRGNVPANAKNQPKMGARERWSKRVARKPADPIAGRGWRKFHYDLRRLCWGPAKTLDTGPATLPAMRHPVFQDLEISPAQAPNVWAGTDKGLMCAEGLSDSQKERSAASE